MLKLSSRCSICKLPPDQREALHTDRWVNHFTYEAIKDKYFPNRSLPAVRKNCGNHFSKCMPFDEFVTEMVDTKTSNPANLPAITPTERSIFTDAYREKIDAIKTLDRMMSTLMDRVNYLQDEWTKIHIATKCDKCGRDDTGPNLVKLLAVFRELREQADTVTKMRNPVALVNKIAEKAFVSFVEEMTDAYVLILNEKSRLIKDAANDFLAGSINQAVFAKRITEVLDDFGGDRLAGAAQEKYQQILSTVMKELKV